MLVLQQPAGTRAADPLQQPAGTRATSSSPAARARSLVLTLVNVIAMGLLLIPVSLYDLLAVVAGAANIRA